MSSHGTMNSGGRHAACLGVGEDGAQASNAKDEGLLPWLFCVRRRRRGALQSKVFQRFSAVEGGTPLPPHAEDAEALTPERDPTRLRGNFGEARGAHPSRRQYRR